MAAAAIARTGSLARLFLAWLVICALGAVLGVALVVPRLAGATPYVIETGSMRPGLPPGALVVVRPVDASRLAPGDVITYQLASGDPTVVTHRIVEQGIDATGTPRFRTQGDANDAADPGWVRPVQIKGERWYAVPLIGHATNLLTGAQRHLVLIGVVAFLLGYAAVMFAGDLRDRRTRREVPS